MTRGPGSLGQELAVEGHQLLSLGVPAVLPEDGLASPHAHLRSQLPICQQTRDRCGHRVAIVEEAKKVGRDVNPSYIWRYVKKLKEGEVQVLSKSKPAEITDEGVRVIGPGDAETVVPADTVVVANVTALNEMEDALKEVTAEVHVVGDAAMPRRVHNATMDGHKVGLAV